MKNRICSKLSIFAVCSLVLLGACVPNNRNGEANAPTISKPIVETMDREETSTMRVMTFNLKANDSIDPVKQAEWVSSFEPDVLATQEVDCFTLRNNLDVPDVFSKVGGFRNYFFSSQMKFQHGDYGLAMYSNYDVLSEKTINVYSDDYLEDKGLREKQKVLFRNMDSADQETVKDYEEFCIELEKNGKISIEPNVIQKIEVDVGGKTVSLYGVHLSYEMKEIRDKQREQLLEMLENEKNVYYVVVGDFNSESADEEMKDFLNDEKFNIANGKDGKWVVTWPAYPEEGEETYFLDNIVTSKNIEITNVNYEKTEYSDHIMMCADLILK